MPGTESVINYSGGEAFIDQDSGQPFFWAPNSSLLGANGLTGEKLFNITIFFLKQKRFQSSPFLFKVWC